MKPKTQPPIDRLPPVHPSEILREDFMVPLGLSQNALAKALCVPPRRVNEIVHGKRGITLDTAMRLSRYFGTSVGIWLGLQLDYELDVAEDSWLPERINNEVTPLPRSTGIPDSHQETHAG
jgi:antitoxin HigA-1